MATPTSIANAKSLRVSPPNSNSDRMGITTTSDVFTERMIVWLSERLTTPLYPRRATIAGDSVCSLILS